MLISLKVSDQIPFWSEFFSRQFFNVMFLALGPDLIRKQFWGQSSNLRTRGLINLYIERTESIK